MSIIHTYLPAGFTEASFFPIAKDGFLSVFLPGGKEKIIETVPGCIASRETAGTFIEGDAKEAPSANGIDVVALFLTHLCPVCGLNEKCPKYNEYKREVEAELEWQICEGELEIEVEGQTEGIWAEREAELNIGTTNEA
jgi:hypothetical protein